MPSPIAAVIDELLTAPKVIAGTPAWVQASRAGHVSWSAMLETEDGEPTSIKWIVDAAPTWSDKPFSIHLAYRSRPIWRVEMAEFCSHMNRPGAPAGCKVGLIQGPHQHSWALNKHLCSRAEPPDRLCYAVQMAPQIRGLDNTMRWFCGEAQIVIDFQLPEYPKPTLLDV